MSNIIALTNQKGGVGKTTTAGALVTGLHQHGYRVLGIDLDPQGNLGFSMGMDVENSRTIYDVFKGTVPFDEAICSTELGDVVASNILLSGAELEFSRPGREFLLKNALSRVEGQYDYIIIDTPPALNVLTVNAYVASNQLIIPMVPEILSLLGVSQIKETIDTVKNFYNPNLTVLGILLTRFNSRINLAREVRDMALQIATQLDSIVFDTTIRTSVVVAEAPAHGESVLQYAPHSKPAQDYAALLDEIIGLTQPQS